MGSGCSRSSVEPYHVVSCQQSNYVNIIQVRETIASGSVQSNGTIPTFDRLKTYCDLKSVHIMITGPQKSGKSTIAYQIARKYDQAKLHLKLQSFIHRRLVTALRSTISPEMRKAEYLLNYGLPLAEESFDLMQFPKLRNVAVNILTDDKQQEKITQLINDGALDRYDAKILQNSLEYIHKYRSSSEDYAYMLSTGDVSEMEFNIKDHSATIYEVRSDTEVEEVPLQNNAICDAVLFVLAMDTLFEPRTAPVRPIPGKLQPALKQFTQMVGALPRNQTSLVFLILHKGDLLMETRPSHADGKPREKLFDEAVTCVRHEFLKVLKPSRRRQFYLVTTTSRAPARLSRTIDEIIETILSSISRKIYDQFIVPY